MDLCHNMSTQFNYGSVAVAFWVSIFFYVAYVRKVLKKEENRGYSQLGKPKWKWCVCNWKFSSTDSFILIHNSFSENVELHFHYIIGCCSIICNRMNIYLNGRIDLLHFFSASSSHISNFIYIFRIQASIFEKLQSKRTLTWWCWWWWWCSTKVE